MKSQNVFFLFLIFVGLCFFYQGYSQIRFQKTFGGVGDDVAWFVQQTSDGGYLICGSTTSFGNGGKDAYVIKTDSIGSEIWSKTFGGNIDDEATYGLEDRGTYYIGGYTASYGAGGNDGFLAHLDSLGGMLWFKTYGTSNPDYGTLKFHKTIDDGFILCYPYAYNGYFSYTLTKTDINGTTQWSHTYGGTQTNVALDVFQMPDSTYLFTGASFAYGMGSHDFLTSRVDNLGNILWDKTIGTTVNEATYSISRLNNNAAFLVGHTQNSLFGSDDVVFLKMNSLTGSILWANQYGKAGMWYQPKFGTETQDHGFACPLFDYSPNPNHKMGILRTDSMGNILWAKKYGGSLDNIANSVWCTTDNGFALVGYTTSFGVSAKDIYFVKTDANGESGCNDVTDTLQQAVYSYSETYPVLPVIFPSESYNGYNLSTINSSVESINNLCSSQCTTYDVRVCIDSHDKLHVQGTRMWWEHISGQYPGEHPWCSAYNSSISVNGQQWSPWDSSFQINNVDNDSLSIDVIQCYNRCNLIQSPNANNGWETIYDFDDSIPTGPHVYEISFIYCKALKLISSIFQSSDTVICTDNGGCINFVDHSTGNPTSWQWFFPGATPGGSTQQNPTNICYTNPGTYAVSLIVSNAAGSDTLTVSPMITVGSTPPQPVITVVGGDTLLCTQAHSYQWYYNGFPIAGATDSLFVEHQDGTYSVYITDSLGCSSISNGVLINSINELFVGKNTAISFSPFSHRVNFTKAVEAAELMDASGRTILLQLDADHKSAVLSDVAKGIYLIQFLIKGNQYRQKLLIE